MTEPNQVGADEQDFQELQAYYAGTPEDRSAAARRLDERALREGQISQDDFESTWGTGSARRTPSPFDPTTTPPLTARQDADVRPLETPAGVDVDMESPEGATGTQAGADAAQAARRSRREQLVVLLSRMQRGVMLDAERPLLRAAVETEIADAEKAYTQLERLQRSLESAAHACTVLHSDNVQLRDERDRARRVAVKLEQQVAAVAALHVYNAEADYCDLCASHGDTEWPCATIRALGPQEGQ